MAKNVNLKKFTVLGPGALRSPKIFWLRAVAKKIFLMDLIFEFLNPKTSEYVNFLNFMQKTKKLITRGLTQ